MKKLLKKKEHPRDVVTGSDVAEAFQSRQGHLKFFRLRIKVMTCSSQSRVTRIVESLRVNGLQAGVNVESHEISRFSTTFFSYEMAPNML